MIVLTQTYICDRILRSCAKMRYYMSSLILHRQRNLRSTKIQNHAKFTMRVDCRMAVTISGFQYWRLRRAARAPALSNVQTFALYFNFATLNIPSPPTSSAPALSPSRRVCNNSLIPGDESPVVSPLPSFPLTPFRKVHFNQATCLIWRHPRCTDNNR